MLKESGGAVLRIAVMSFKRPCLPSRMLVPLQSLRPRSLAPRLMPAWRIRWNGQGLASCTDVIAGPSSMQQNMASTLSTRRLR